MWECLCDCGKTCSVLRDGLVSGKTTSCGCYWESRVKQTNTKHKDKGNPLYGVWNQIKMRCFDKNATHYMEYGGRGISVCEEWKNDYLSFRQWAYSSGYEPGLTIDRIDNDGNYEPDNCRWVDRKAQANNRRSNVMYTYNGETLNVTQWAKRFNIPPKTLFNRLYTGWDFQTAISAPKNTKRKFIKTSN